MKGLINKIFSNGASELTDSIGNTIDQLSTSETEKLNAKNELSGIVLDKLTELGSFQRDALIAELQGSKLQRSWRPILMLCFGFIVIYAKFIAPCFNLPNTDLEPSFWSLLELGIGGYVIGRSVEKVADRVTQNIDISFLKKKNRKIN